VIAGAPASQRVRGRLYPKGSASKSQVTSPLRETTRQGVRSGHGNKVRPGSAPKRGKAILSPRRPLSTTRNLVLGSPEAVVDGVLDGGRQRTDKRPARRGENPSRSWCRARAISRPGWRVQGQAQQEFVNLQGGPGGAGSSAPQDRRSARYPVSSHSRPDLFVEVVSRERRDSDLLCRAWRWLRHRGRPGGRPRPDRPWRRAAGRRHARRRVGPGRPAAALAGVRGGRIGRSPRRGCAPTGGLDPRDAGGGWPGCG
jgi:hypothetical protein